MPKPNPKKRYTTRQIMAGFSVSDMTVYTWRQGTPTREKLPTEQDGRNVFFPHTSTLAWAKKEGLPFSVEKADTALTAPKSGPKPVAAKKAAAKKVKEVKPAPKKREPKRVRSVVKNTAVAGPAAAHV